MVVKTARTRSRSVLVVDDEPGIRAFLQQSLTVDRYSVTTAETGEEAIERLAHELSDIALVDVVLPGMSGLDLVEVIREGGPDAPWDAAMPVVLLSGLADPHSPVRGLERGADDYLAKPFHYPELLARMGGLLRRTRGPVARGTLRVGPLLIDRQGRRARLYDQALELSMKEFDLLVALATSPFRVVTKQELLRDVWGYVGSARTRTVDSHASRLRCKLTNLGRGQSFVTNIWGVGYRLLSDDA